MRAKAGSRRDEAEYARLAHPGWWLALVLLLLNDHLLKGSGIAPHLTGKLSDLAGLVVAPPLAAVLLAWAGQRARRVGFWSVVAVFVGIKVSAPVARAVEECVSFVGIDWRLWTDPTDLGALVVLPWSWRLAFGPVSSFGQGDRLVGLTHRIGVILGALACLATSDDYVPTAPAYVVNATRFGIELSTSRMNASIDCSALAGREQVLLHRNQFVVTTMRSLSPMFPEALSTENRAPDGGSGDCGAVLLEGPGLDPVIVAWSGVPFIEPPNGRPFAVVPPQTVVLRGTREQLVPSFGRGLMAIDPATTTEGSCSVSPGTPLTWDGFEPGTFILVDVGIDADECLEVVLGDPGGDAGPPDAVAQLCAPPETFPFAPGDTVALRSGVDRLEVEADTPRRLARFTQGSAPEAFSPADCEGVELVCDAIVLPITVEDPPGFPPGSYAAGDSIDAAGQSFFLLRAEQIIRADADCAAGRDTLGPVYDTAVVEAEVSP